MKHHLLIISMALGLSACVAYVPSASSSVIESSEQGSLISITTEHCGFTCTDLAMEKAKQTCPKGFSIKSKQGGQTTGGLKDVNMVIRCDD